MTIRTRCLLYLLLLGIVDVVIPVPIVAIVLLYVLIKKPPWFQEAVFKIYDVERS